MFLLVEKNIVFQDEGKTMGVGFVECNLMISGIFAYSRVKLRNVCL